MNSVQKIQAQIIWATLIILVPLYEIAGQIIMAMIMSVFAVTVGIIILIDTFKSVV